MARYQLETEFPNLSGAEWCLKSPWDDTYTCIAWAAGGTDRTWWPGKDYYWPPGLPVIDPPEIAPTEYFIQGFGTLGYKPCDSSTFEIGYQKVAIYANEIGVTHMARQHFAGRGWLSKLGSLEDIRHSSLTDVEGSTAALAGQYGEVVQILKRSWLIALLDPLTYRGWFSVFRFWIQRAARRS